MKKILFVALFIGTLAASVTAQYTTPRQGTGYRVDGRKNTTLSYITPTDAASSTIDTFAVAPNAFHTIYRITLVDSVCAGAPTVTNCYAGDQITFILSCASGTPFLRFIGSNWITAGTATMTTRKRSVIKFVFDGTNWTESGRYTQ